MVNQRGNGHKLASFVLGILDSISAAISSSNKPFVLLQQESGLAISSLNALCVYLSLRHFFTHPEKGYMLTNHPSSASRVPRFRITTLVPGGQLNAGLAPVARRLAVLDIFGI
jgi:hypothetical protein